ncbi:hypothetical protein CM15mP35_05780 [bacterium]|nr:MAG: hypothetical protein CM15mP35_05780 [bacterium]
MFDDKRPLKFIKKFLKNLKQGKFKFLYVFGFPMDVKKKKEKI